MLPVWLTDTVTPDLDRALHYTLLWGLEGVVLRTVGTRGDRVPHINEAKLRRRLAEYEIEVVAIDPGLFEHAAEARGAWLNDLSVFPEVAAFCARVGCSRVIVGALPGDDTAAAEALRQAGALAARHGLVLAVKNEVDGRPTGRSVAALLDEVGHPSVQAAWSPADALEAGEASADGSAALGGRVVFVSVRDGEMRPEGWVPRSLGTGGVGWQDALRNLDAAGYDGPLSLDFRDLDASGKGLSEATALIRMVRQARRR